MKCELCRGEVDEVNDKERKVGRAKSEAIAHVRW